MLEHIIAPFDHGWAGNYCIQVLAEVVHVLVHDYCMYAWVGTVSVCVSVGCVWACLHVYLDEREQKKEWET